MLISKITKFGKDWLEVENCENGKVVLNIGYEEPNNTVCGIYLTEKEIIRLCDWLTRWLKKQGK
jgi:hypothetical protein